MFDKSKMDNIIIYHFKNNISNIRHPGPEPGSPGHDFTTLKNVRFRTLEPKMSKMRKLIFQTNFIF